MPKLHLRGVCDSGEGVASIPVPIRQQPYVLTALGVDHCMVTINVSGKGFTLSRLGVQMRESGLE